MAVQFAKSRALELFNLTPMIDMVFLLLIFFLVASQFAEEERALEVALPEGSQAMPITQRPRELFLNIDEQGRYYVDRKLLSYSELQNLLRQAKANNPLSQTVVIRADKRAQWDFVAAAFRACQEAGITEVLPAYDEP